MNTASWTPTFWSILCIRRSSTIRSAGLFWIRGQAGELALCVVPQVLGELYAVITDSRRVTNTFEPDEALNVIEQILAMPNLVVMPTPLDLVMRWIALVRRYPVKRGGVFDVQLVATMLANEVRRVYTFNRPHFEKFSELEVLTP